MGEEVNLKSFNQLENTFKSKMNNYSKEINKALNILNNLMNERNKYFNDNEKHRKILFRIYTVLKKHGYFIISCDESVLFKGYNIFFSIKYEINSEIDQILLDIKKWLSEDYELSYHSKFDQIMLSIKIKNH